MALGRGVVGVVRDPVARPHPGGLGVRYGGKFVCSNLGVGSMDPWRHLVRQEGVVGSAVHVDWWPEPVEGAGEPGPRPRAGAAAGGRGGGGGGGCCGCCCCGCCGCCGGRRGVSPPVAGPAPGPPAPRPPGPPAPLPGGHQGPPVTHKLQPRAHLGQRGRKQTWFWINVSCTF